MSVILNLVMIGSLLYGSGSCERHSKPSHDRKSPLQFWFMCHSKPMIGSLLYGSGSCERHSKPMIGSLLYGSGSCECHSKPMIGSLLYSSGSCERHSKPIKEMFGPLRPTPKGDALCCHMYERAKGDALCCHLYERGKGRCSVLSFV